MRIHRGFIETIVTPIVTIGFSIAAEATPYLQGTVTVGGVPYADANVSLFCESEGIDSIFNFSSSDESGAYSMDTDNVRGPCGSDSAGITFTSCLLFAQPSMEELDLTISQSDNYSVPVPLSCDSPAMQDIPLNVLDKTIAATVTAAGASVTSGLIIVCSLSDGGGSYEQVTEPDAGVYRVPARAGEYLCSAGCIDFADCPVDTFITETVVVGEDDTEIPVAFDYRQIHLTVWSGSDPVASGVTVICQEQEEPWTWVTAPVVDGAVDFFVNAGNYYCSAAQDDPAGTLAGFPAVELTLEALVVEGELVFSLRDKTIQVTVTDGTSLVTDGISVFASEEGGSFSSTTVSEVNPDTGTYDIPVSHGRFYVSAACDNQGECAVAGCESALVRMGEVDSTAAVTIECLATNSTITGIVTAAGSPVEGAGVNIFSYRVSEMAAAVETPDGTIGDDEPNGADIPAALGLAPAAPKRATAEMMPVSESSVSLYVQTNASGAFSVMVPAGSYEVCGFGSDVNPQYGQACTTVSAAADATAAVSIQLPVKTAQIVVSVTDEDGNPVPMAFISGWSYNGYGLESDWFFGETGEDGTGTFYAIEGLRYEVYASYWSNDPENTICPYSTDGIRTVMAAATPQTATFSFPTCDCALSLRAVAASAYGDILDGAIVSSLFGGVNCSPSTLAADELWYGIWGEVSSGVGQMKVREGVEYLCSLYSWEDSFVSDDDMTTTCAGGSGSIDFSMLPLDAEISGNCVDEDGAAISADEAPEIEVFVNRGNNFRHCEVSECTFSCRVSAGTWCLASWSNPSSGFTAAPTTACATVGAESTTTQDLTLYRVGVIQASVEDTDGNPMGHTWIEACPFSNAHLGSEMPDAALFYGCSGCPTEGDGSCSIYVGASGDADGTTYYLNAYVPFDQRGALVLPQEVSVDVRAGEEVEADPLIFQAPDGSSVITVTQGAAGGALRVLGRSVRRQAADDDDGDDDDGDDDSSVANPVVNATVDCFSPAGWAFEEVTDENGQAVCPCATGARSFAVAYNIVPDATTGASTLWMSDVAGVTCTETGGTGALALEQIASLPLGSSATLSDAATQEVNIELSDRFKFTCPAGCFGSGRVTVNVEPTLTPFTANRRPVNWYGYQVSATDETGASIIELQSNATLCMPYDADQIATTGLTIDTSLPSYFDTSTGAYDTIDTCTVEDPVEVDGQQIGRVCCQQDHLTSFAIVGNGEVAGLTADDVGGEEEDEAGGSGDDEAGAGASGGCGCRLTGEPPVGETAWAWVICLGVASILLRSRRRRRTVD